VPPPQCPECGRFLSNGFVRGLLSAPASCPRCDALLTAGRFAGSDALATGPGSSGESVRPPDLAPASVRPERDVLEGWDRPTDVLPGREAGDLAAGWARTVATVVAAGVAGGLLGAVLSRRNRPVLAALGTVVGAGAAVLGSRDAGRSPEVASLCRR
jgi:hypothetical protein